MVWRIGRQCLRWPGALLCGSEGRRQERVWESRGRPSRSWPTLRSAYHRPREAEAKRSQARAAIAKVSPARAGQT
jgi:hypothetical protein